MVAVWVCCRGEEPSPPAGGQSRTPPPHRDILSTEKAAYSNANEEIIIRDFFQDRRGGFFLDVGCAQPIDGSNTFYLEERLEWTGIGVDALPEFDRKWRRHRRNSKFFNYLVTDHDDTVEPFFRAEPRVKGISAIEKPARGPGGDPVESEEIQVPTTTLTRILERSGVARIDLLSMDIEGAEPLALAGFDIERFRPELVCVEAKPRNRETLERYFSDHGYRRIERYLAYDGTNCYYTPRSRP